MLPTPRQIILAALMALSPAALAAEDRSGEWLHDFFDTSSGYANLGADMVLVDGAERVELCRFLIAPELFDGSVPAEGAATFACVPVAQFVVGGTSRGLDTSYKIAEAIDESEGYVPLGPNTLLIEGWEQIDICRFTIPDAFFAAAAVGDATDDLPQSDQPSVTCLPFNEVFK